MIERRGDPVLVVRRAALGDFVLTLPVLRALATCAPVHVVTEARYLPLLPAGVTRIADAWLWRGDPPPCRYRYAVAFGEVAVEALADSGVGPVRGVASRPPPGVHAVDHYLAALDGLDLPVTRAPQVLVPGVDAGSGAGPVRPVVFAPGSGGVEKRWPLSRWRAVADGVQRHGAPVVWVRGPDEREEAGWPPAISPDVAGLVALAARCGAWLGPDSGPSHVAAAAGASVGVVFGPSDPSSWAPVPSRVWPWDTAPGELAAWARDVRVLRISDGSR